MLFDGPQDAECAIILAHGAGAAMDSGFMQFFAKGLAGRGLRVARFEFPYMQRIRESGAKKPPDREPVLRDAWLAAIASVDAERIVIGGKSLGGRIASLIADESRAPGLVCLGYPFHPPGKPDRLRTEHLKSLKTPALIVQGERDPFGKREEVESYELSSSIEFCWMTDGDHSLKPRKASGLTLEENWGTAIERIVQFAGR